MTKNKAEFVSEFDGFITDNDLPEDDLSSIIFQMGVRVASAISLFALLYFLVQGIIFLIQKIHNYFML
jgi:hypothetical protein